MDGGDVGLSRFLGQSLELDAPEGPLTCFGSVHVYKHQRERG